MSVFDDLQQQHSRLLARQQANEPVLEDVKAYIEAVRAAGRQIADVHQRDQLRANLRYWAGYAFDREGAYPTTDLEAGPGALSAIRLRLSGLSIAAAFVIIGVVVVSVVIAVVSLEDGGTGGPASPTPTSVPLVATTVAPATQAPSPAPEITETLIPISSLTPAAQATATPNAPGIVVQFTNLKSGDDIKPQMTVTGSYANLQSGWSIHVVLQPIGTKGVYFPVKDYFLISSTAEAAAWSLPVAFGDGPALAAAEQYVVTIGVALSDLARAALSKSLAGGLTALPSDFFLIPQSAVIVDRAAYTVVAGDRLLYVKAGDIYLAEPDGADPQRWVESSPMTFVSPSLSPSGERIAVVGVEVGVQSLWLMDSDGSHPSVVVSGAGAVFERPVWSPDGRFIAFAASIPVAEQTSADPELYVYEVATDELSSLSTGLRSSRYPSWTPSGDRLVFSAFGDTHTLGLFTIDFATGTVAELLDTDVEETQPVVSPDSQWVAYVGYPVATSEGNRDIYVVNWDSKETRRLTENGALDWRPAWATDSRHIYFESSRGRGPLSIWSVTLDGEPATSVIDEAGVELTWPFVGKIFSAFLPIGP